MEEGTYYFSESGFWFFVPKRLAWERVKFVFSEEDHDEECILCEKFDKNLVQKGDTSFA